MSASHKSDLDHRLEAYFATLRPSALRAALKRSAANWHLYAAVTSSTLAMATGASAAAIIGAGGGSPRGSVPEPSANVIPFEPPASFKEIPLLNAVKMAVARQGGGGVGLDQASLTQAPSIAAGGIVPLFSSVNTIQPGELISIYGSNLANETTTSNGGFPTTLGGTTVKINGKAAYLLFVSPDQINLQAPDDTATGPVSVVVTNAAGSATSSVTLSSVAPAFTLLDATYVCGIILRSNGAGAYGNGSYDILGPTGNSFGYPTVAAMPGDVVELFAVGFGPTHPFVPAGQVFSGAAPITGGLTLTINNLVVKPSFAGLSSAGLYQINLVVPSGLGSGNVSIVATVNGVQTQPGILFALQNGSTFGSTGGTGGTYVGGGGLGFGGGTCCTFGGTTGNPPGGTNGAGGTNAGGGGGTNGGGAGTNPGTNAAHKKHYTPRLTYPPK